MKVQMVVPEPRAVELQTLVQEFSSVAEGPTRPFDPQVIDFCAEFSRALFRSTETRPFPEIQALAFWMRRAELLRLKEEFLALETDHTILVPRGLVFHVPPANVDTIFIYSWLLSMLVGNRNVVRLSTRRSPQTVAICSVLNQVLARSEFQSIRAGTTMIVYGHEAEITAALSTVADVRVIWGGDRAVTAIRAVPLPPHARDLTFSDRYSLAVFHAGEYLRIGAEGRAELGERFFNDSYWFDQMGCSSPRLIVWCGAADRVRQASGLFFGELRRVVAGKGYTVDAGVAINKLVFSYRAVLDLPVREHGTWGNEVSLLGLDDLSVIRREEHCGAGLFFQARVSDLTDLEPFVCRRDQTLTHFGFEASELSRFARRLNGRGLDRLVPVGQALTFNRFWDGYDLLQEFTRRVYMQTTDAHRFGAASRQRESYAPARGGEPTHVQSGSAVSGTAC